MTRTALMTAVDLVKAPLMYKGKVRELYDLGNDQMLIVVTDRISAFDYVLEPGIPDKGNVLNLVTRAWFEVTAQFMQNHMIHCDIDQLGDIIVDKEVLRHRIMVTRKATRIPVECVVRGYVTGGGWRQYQETGMINGRELPAGLRKNERLPHPIFTPAKKNDVGHDEDITIAEMEAWLGEKLTAQLAEKSIMLYVLAHAYCEDRGIVLADTKLEFGFIDDEILLIDEIFTPDSSRFWAMDKYDLDIEIDSMDKEPVRTFLANSNWDKNSQPDPLPAEVVEETAQRYTQILHALFQEK
ncbi:phosphoribosylaminoimidazolesuccinocarboxamide synthase [Paenibacillus albiflavus]|uniref:Phosphoribosylaminoimidazole-succinocarboxamide synthase n=1 Tax=Paenibacillus albiflavus TaxID=2545760 RepID=A0A4R4EFB3_9BACL|nr:phosphoribosylaminoimidazolesuccinocarboxamide synthase [Paenibacillus albiflavus]TCZ78439.1 phosphoribosylaminoimidazolesuccinocarboxamide synthase [Paenibacillus albiflavus]